MEEQKEQRVRSVSQGIQRIKHPGWGLYSVTTKHCMRTLLLWFGFTTAFNWSTEGNVFLYRVNLSYKKNQKHKTWILKLLREVKGYLRMRLRKDYTDLFKERPEGTAFLILFGSIHWKKKKKGPHSSVLPERKKKQQLSLQNHCNLSPSHSTKLRSVRVNRLWGGRREANSLR